MGIEDKRAEEETQGENSPRGQWRKVVRFHVTDYVWKEGHAEQIDPTNGLEKISKRIAGIPAEGFVRPRGQRFSDLVKLEDLDREPR